MSGTRKIKGKTKNPKSEGNTPDSANSRSPSSDASASSSKLASSHAASATTNTYQPPRATTPPAGGVAQKTQVIINSLAAQRKVIFDEALANITNVLKGVGAANLNVMNNTLETKKKLNGQPIGEDKIHAMIKRRNEQFEHWGLQFSSRSGTEDNPISSPQENLATLGKELEKKYYENQDKNLDNNFKKVFADIFNPLTPLFKTHTQKNITLAEMIAAPQAKNSIKILEKLGYESAGINKVFEDMRLIITAAKAEVTITPHGLSEEELAKRQLEVDESLSEAQRIAQQATEKAEALAAQQAAEKIAADAAALDTEINELNTLITAQIKVLNKESVTQNEKDTATQIAGIIVPATGRGLQARINLLPEQTKMTLLGNLAEVLSENLPKLQQSIQRIEETEAAALQKAQLLKAATEKAKVLAEQAAAAQKATEAALIKRKSENEMESLKSRVNTLLKNIEAANNGLIEEIEKTLTSTKVDGILSDYRKSYQPGHSISFIENSELASTIVKNSNEFQQLQSLIEKWENLPNSTLKSILINDLLHSKIKNLEVINNSSDNRRTKLTALSEVEKNITAHNIELRSAAEVLSLNPDEASLIIAEQRRDIFVTSVSKLEELKNQLSPLDQKSLSEIKSISELDTVINNAKKNLEAKTAAETAAKATADAAKAEADKAKAQADAAAAKAAADAVKAQADAAKADAAIAQADAAAAKATADAVKAEADKAKAKADAAKADAAKAQADAAAAKAAADAVKAEADAAKAQADAAKADAAIAQADAAAAKATADAVKAEADKAKAQADAAKADAAKAQADAAAAKAAADAAKAEADKAKAQADAAKADAAIAQTEAAAAKAAADAAAAKAAADAAAAKAAADAAVAKAAADAAAAKAAADAAAAKAAADAATAEATRILALIKSDIAAHNKIISEQIILLNTAPADPVKLQALITSAETAANTALSTETTLTKRITGLTLSNDEKSDLLKTIEKTINLIDAIKAAQLKLPKQNLTELQKLQQLANKLDTEVTELSNLDLIQGNLEVTEADRGEIKSSLDASTKLRNESLKTIYTSLTSILSTIPPESIADAEKLREQLFKTEETMDGLDKTLNKADAIIKASQAGNFYNLDINKLCELAKNRVDNIMPTPTNSTANPTNVSQRRKDLTDHFILRVIEADIFGKGDLGVRDQVKTDWNTKVKPLHEKIQSEVNELLAMNNELKQKPKNLDSTVEKNKKDALAYIEVALKSYGELPDVLEALKEQIAVTERQDSINPDKQWGDQIQLQASHVEKHEVTSTQDTAEKVQAALAKFDIKTANDISGTNSNAPLILSASNAAGPVNTQIKHTNLKIDYAKPKTLTVNIIEGNLSGPDSHHTAYTTQTGASVSDFKLEVHQLIPTSAANTTNGLPEDKYLQLTAKFVEDFIQATSRPGMNPEKIIIQGKDEAAIKAAVMYCEAMKATVPAAQQAKYNYEVRGNVMPTFTNDKAMRDSVFAAITDHTKLCMQTIKYSPKVMAAAISAGITDHNVAKDLLKNIKKLDGTAIDTVIAEENSVPTRRVK